MSWYDKYDPKSIVRIQEDDNSIVEYDRIRGMYRVSFFEDGHFQDEVWFDAYEEKELAYTDVLANRVEEKMEYMCGCRNCIENVKMIITDQVKPFKNYCAECKIDCDHRST